MNKGREQIKDFFIGVATHKPYAMPNNPIYKPIQVGAKGKATISNYLRDDLGENISELNSNFSELTAIYYIWKNVNANYKGLVHYRRYFKNHSKILISSKGDPFNLILDSKSLEKIFRNANVILPKKRKYYIETNYSHFKHAHKIESLDLTQSIISAEYPQYLEKFNEVLKRRSAHMFNMFIMRSSLFDEYCEWLFSILFTLQQKLDISTYLGQEARVFGYISELLLDVWIETNNVDYVEEPVLYLEGQQLLKKGSKFLKRKIIGSGDAHIQSHIE